MTVAEYLMGFWCVVSGYIVDAGRYSFNFLHNDGSAIDAVASLHGHIRILEMERAGFFGFE